MAAIVKKQDCKSAEYLGENLDKELSGQGGKGASAILSGNRGEVGRLKDKLLVDHCFAL